MTTRLNIGVTLAIIGLIVLVHSKTLDQVGLNATDAGLNRALVTFGISRGLNGVISVMQGTEVAVEPVGVGMTFTPGQILDPVNDLIERFSTIVLVAGTAFGVQKIAMDVSSAPFYTWFITGLLVLLIVVIWGKANVPAWLFNSLAKAAIIALIIRFAVPILAISSDLLYQHFLSQQFETSTNELNLTSDKLNDLRAESEQDVTNPDNDKSSTHSQDNTSLIDKAKQLYQSARHGLNIQSLLNEFKVAAETISEHAIRLMVVFIFQTLVFPLLSVWLVLKLLRATLSYSTPRR